jgi:hypothetical protein
MLSKDRRSREGVDMAVLLSELGFLVGIWFLLGLLCVGDMRFPNFFCGFLLVLMIIQIIQNSLVWISPYLIWMALVPLVPLGLWLGKVLEKRLNPLLTAKDPNQIPPL